MAAPVESVVARITTAVGGAELDSREADLLTLKRRANASVLSASVIGNAGRARRRRPKKQLTWKQILALLKRAREKGQVTDKSHQALSLLLASAERACTNAEPSELTDCSTAPSVTDSPHRIAPSLDMPSMDDDLLSEDDTRPDFGGACSLSTIYRPHPWRSSSQPAQQKSEADLDALKNDLVYRRSHLWGAKADGLSVGIAGRCPLDSQAAQCARVCTVRRELPPLRLCDSLLDPDTGRFCGECVKDLNMPGATEWLLKKCEELMGTPAERIEGIVRAKASAMRASLAQHYQYHADLPETEVEEDVALRQQDFLVQSLYEVPEPSPNRHVEASDLYKRLARALDQRVPPAERLFSVKKRPTDSIIKSTSRISKKTRPWWDEARVFESKQPVWMRASASKQAYGNGSDIFPLRYQSRLRDYDPDRCQF